MSLPDDDDSIHQHTDDACVAHDPHCAAFLGSNGLCNECWAVEHENHTSQHCEESCPYCKPLIAKLDATEALVSKYSRSLASATPTRYPTDLASDVCRLVSYCYPEYASMVARMNADGIAYDIALSAIKKEQGAQNGF